MVTRDKHSGKMHCRTAVCPTAALWAVLVVLISSLIPHASYATVIRLRENATAGSTLVTLGDVAEISETDEENATRLKRLTLAPAPAAGRSLRIDIDRVRRELTLRGIDQTEISFIGPSESLVVHKTRRKKREFSPQSDYLDKIRELLDSSISKYIEDRAPELNSIHVEIPDEQSRRIAALYAAGSSIKIMGGQPPWTGTQQLHVQFVDRNNQIQNILLPCRVSIKQRALALKLGLPRGKVIREGDLIWVDPDLSSNGKPFFTSLEDVVGTETIKNIRAQTPIHPEDIRQLPLVKRNDIVAVYARVGDVVVRRYCRSHDEGAKGQYVTLTPIDGKAKVTARVSGFREAEIVLDDPSLQQSIQTVGHVGTVNIGTANQLSGQRLQDLKPTDGSQIYGNGKMRSASYRQAATTAPSKPIQVRIQANRPVQLP